MTTEKKPQIRIKAQDVQAIFVFLSAAFVWTAAYLHAARACLTYDEAFSYVYYIHPLQLTKLSSVQEIFTDCLANNHILNTILCNLAVKISGKVWTDFIIRVPALLFCAIYLFLVILLFCKKEIGYMTAALLVWNYYLNEFFALARGYGLAAAMVMAAAVMYCFWCRRGKFRYLSLFLVFMTLGVMANTIVLLIFAAFIPYIFYQLLRSKKLLRYIGGQCFVWLPMLLVNIWLLRYHLMVSEEGKPLYVGSGGVWNSVVKGYLQTFTANRTLAGILSIGLVFAAAGAVLLLINLKTIDQTRFLIPTLTYFIILLVLAHVLHMGLPRGRTLLPAYAVMVLCFMECLTALWRFCKERLIPESRERTANILKQILGAAICLILLVLFVKETDLYSYTDWRDEKDYRTIAYDAVDNPEADFEAIANMDYPMQYYWAQVYLEKGFDIYTGQPAQ